MFKKILLINLLILISFCGKKEETQSKDATTQETENVNEQVTEQEVTEIVIQSVGDQQKFDKTEFTVKAGSKVKLILKNVATMEAMIHNVVITKPETDTNKIGQEAIKAKDKDYVPDNENVLFYTPLAKPGETVEVDFIAPEPGDYPYVCTYIGHYIFMKGVMHIK